MSQTSIIAAAFIVAFIVFITVRGELPKYFGIFTGVAPASQPASAKSASTSSGVTNIAIGGESAPYGWTLGVPNGPGGFWGPGGGGSGLVGFPGELIS